MAIPTLATITTVSMMMMVIRPLLVVNLWRRLNIHRRRLYVHWLRMNIDWRRTHIHGLLIRRLLIDRLIA